MNTAQPRGSPTRRLMRFFWRITGGSSTEMEAEMVRLRRMFVARGFVGDPAKRDSLVRDLVRSGNSTVLSEAVMNALFKRAKADGWRSPWVYIFRVFDDPEWPEFLKRVVPDRNHESYHRFGGSFS